MKIEKNHNKRKNHEITLGRTRNNAKRWKEEEVNAAGRSFGRTIETADDWERRKGYCKRRGRKEIYDTSNIID